MKPEDIQYDTPIEVNMRQYYNIMHRCSGAVAGRKAGGKFYIKVWMMSQVNNVVKAFAL